MPMLTPQNDFQAPNIPVDIDPDSPIALRQVIEMSRQMVQRINELEQRIATLEEEA